MRRTEHKMYDKSDFCLNLTMLTYHIPSERKGYWLPKLHVARNHKIKKSYNAL